MERGSLREHYEPFFQIRWSEFGLMNCSKIVQKSANFLKRTLRCLFDLLNGIVVGLQWGLYYGIGKILNLLYHAFLLRSIVLYLSISSKDVSNSTYLVIIRVR